MSQENVERAEQVLDAIAEFDFSRVIALTDPDLEWQSFFALGEEGVYRGHDAMRPPLERSTNAESCWCPYGQH